MRRSSTRPESHERSSHGQGLGRLRRACTGDRPRDRHLGSILKNQGEHSAATQWVSLEDLWPHDQKAASTSRVCRATVRRCLTTKRGLEVVFVFACPGPRGENPAICVQAAQSARQQALQETASATAATHTSGPLGIGGGRSTVLRVGNLMCEDSGKGIRLR